MIDYEKSFYTETENSIQLLRAVVINNNPKEPHNFGKVQIKLIDNDEILAQSKNETDIEYNPHITYKKLEHDDCLEWVEYIRPLDYIGDRTQNGKENGQSAPYNFVQQDGKRPGGLFKYVIGDNYTQDKIKQTHCLGQNLWLEVGTWVWVIKGGNLKSPIIIGTAAQHSNKHILANPRVNVKETPSGHLFVNSDELNNEYIYTEHRTGTYTKYKPEGSLDEVIEGDKQSLNSCVQIVKVGNKHEKREKGGKTETDIKDDEFVKLNKNMEPGVYHLNSSQKIVLIVGNTNITIDKNNISITADNAVNIIAKNVNVKADNIKIEGTTNIN